MDTKQLQLGKPSGQIVIVGPVLPYRGGIAQYNTLLSRAFASSDLAAGFFSFSRQYPRWLYPGASDRDSSFVGHAEPKVRYSIDSINPLTWWKTAREIAKQRPGLVVFHWWTVFWAPCFIIMIGFLRRRGFRVALICHNLVDHEASGLKAAISRRVIGMADAYLVHSSDHADILRREWPHKAIELHSIPIYGHYPPARGTLAKRGRIELLFFGFIRPYKGLDVLLGALKLLGDKDVYLTVIGEYWGNPKALVEQHADHPHVELHLRYMSDAEAAEYFERADFVVLPYREATPSAVASVAFHYDTPIIASRVAGLMDVVIDGQTGILVAPKDPEALANVLRTASRSQSQRLAEEVTRYKQSHGWHSLCAALYRLAHVEQPADVDVPH
jgi:glycosyltransferase involved in cell wall biosynthesis